MQAKSLSKYFSKSMVISLFWLAFLEYLNSRQDCRSTPSMQNDTKQRNIYTQTRDTNVCGSPKPWATSTKTVASSDFY